MNTLDRVIEWVAPGWARSRVKARLQIKMARSYYDGASLGRRTAGIRRSSADANTIAERSLVRLRQHSRDLVRNNPHAKRGVEAISSNVGSATPHFRRGKARADDLRDLARDHLETTACDSDGLLTYRGIQNLAMATTVESGMGLLRRRWRRSGDGLPVPVQFQLLEPEYLDTSKDGPTASGGRIVQGVEFDALGRRRFYHLYREHPGGVTPLGLESRPVPARDIAPVFRVDRPGQVVGIPWLAVVLLRIADFNDYEDAQLMRQKIAACFAVFVEESFDNALPGSVTETKDGKLVDAIEPGMIERLPIGTTVKFGDPPTVEGYGDYTNVALHTIAAGLGISYESLNMDVGQVNFAAGKMNRLEMQRNIGRWQRDLLVAQVCVPLMAWWLEAVALTGASTDGVTVEHIAMSGDLIDPTREWKAERDAMRAGQKTLTQAIRERGRDPREHLEEMAEDQKLLDELGIVLDSDPRHRTAAGNEVGGTPSGDRSRPELDDAAVDDLAEALLSRNGAHR